jgi:hypothetical protein
MAWPDEVKARLESFLRPDEAVRRPVQPQG